MTRNAIAAIISLHAIICFVAGAIGMNAPAIIAGVALMIAGAVVGNHYTPGGNP